MNEQDLREQLVSVALRMQASGINQGTSGNLSVRIAGGMLITPSSLPYEQMQPRDLVALDLKGEPLFIPADGRPKRRPSSEWRLHADRDDPRCRDPTAGGEDQAPGDGQGR